MLYSSHKHFYLFYLNKIYAIYSKIEINKAMIFQNLKDIKNS